MNIPKSITKTIYVSIGIGRHNKDMISAYDFDDSGTGGMEGMERVKLCEKEVTFEIPSVDVTGKAISLIEDKKAAISEMFHKEIGKLDQEIQELRALPAPEVEE